MLGELIVRMGDLDAEVVLDWQGRGRGPRGEELITMVDSQIQAMFAREFSMTRRPDKTEKELVTCKQMGTTSSHVY